MSQKLSIDVPGDGSILEALTHDGTQLVEVTQPAYTKAQRLFETVKKVNFTHRLLGKEEGEDTENQAILPEDHFKEAKERIVLTIQEVQRLLGVVTLLHPQQTVEGPTLARALVEHARIPDNTATVLRGVAVLAKREQLQQMSRKLSSSAEGLEVEVQSTRTRMQELLQVRREFQVLATTRGQGLLIQTSCPPAPPSQVQLVSGANSQLTCPELGECSGWQQCAVALKAEVRTNFERGLYDALCAEARLFSHGQPFVILQQLETCLKVDAGIVGAVQIELVDDKQLRVQHQGPLTHPTEQLVRRLFRKLPSSYNVATATKSMLLVPMVESLQHRMCRARVVSLLRDFVEQHKLPEPHWHGTSSATTTTFELRSVRLRLHGILSGMVLSITDAKREDAHTLTLTMDEIPFYLENVITK